MANLDLSKSGPDELDESEFSLIDASEIVVENRMETPSAAQNFNLTNMNSSFAIDSTNLEVINAYLIDLVKENEEMKESLKKNNVMMQEQLATISKWHEQMIQSKNRQQMFLDEANTKIAKLEKENAQLKLRISTNSELMENSQMSSKGDIESILTDTFEELDKCKKEISELKEIIEQRDNKIEDLQHLTKIQAKGINMKQQQVQNFNPSENQIDLGHMLVNKYKYSHGNEETQAKQIEQTEDPEQHGLFHDQNWLWFIIEKSTKEITELKNALRCENQESQDHKNKLIEANRYSEALQQECKRLSTVFEAQMDTMMMRLRSEEADANKLKEEEHFCRIDEISAKLLDTELKLEESQAIARQMKSELDMVREDADKINTLKAQVEVYKSDMDRELKAKMEAEKEVQNLRGELQSLRSEHGSNSSSGTGSRYSKSPKISTTDSMKSLSFTAKKKQPRFFHWDTPTNTQSDDESTNLICPVCGTAFVNQAALESHVNECLDRAGTH